MRGEREIIIIIEFDKGAVEARVVFTVRSIAEYTPIAGLDMSKLGVLLETGGFIT